MCSPFPREGYHGQHDINCESAFSVGSGQLVAVGSLYGKHKGALAASTSAGGAHALASRLLTLRALGASILLPAILSLPSVRTHLGAQDWSMDPALTKELQSVVVALMAAAISKVA